MRVAELCFCSLVGLPSPCPPHPYLPPPWSLSSLLPAPRPVPARRRHRRHLRHLRHLGSGLVVAPNSSPAAHRRRRSSSPPPAWPIATEPVVNRCRSFCRNSLMQAPSSSSPAACSPSSSSSRQHHPSSNSAEPSSNSSGTNSSVPAAAAVAAQQPAAISKAVPTIWTWSLFEYFVAFIFGAGQTCWS